MDILKAARLMIKDSNELTGGIVAQDAAVGCLISQHVEVTTSVNEYTHREWSELSTRDALDEMIEHEESHVDVDYQEEAEVEPLDGRFTFGGYE